MIYLPTTQKKLFMNIHGIDYTAELIDALCNNNIVIFAGRTGVSFYSPSNCPLFVDLAEKITKNATLKKETNETIDYFLGRIANHGIGIRTQVKKILYTEKFNEVHTSLLKLYNHNTQEESHGY